MSCHGMHASAVPHPQDCTAGRAKNDGSGTMNMALAGTLQLVVRHATLPGVLFVETKRLL